MCPQLYTHASLMLTNTCLGERIQYEATTAAIFMAGIFLSFLADFFGARFIIWRQGKGRTPASDDERHPTPSSTEFKSPPVTDDNCAAVMHNHADDSHSHTHGYADEKVGVIVLEAGIIFHSFCKLRSVLHLPYSY
jgi:zinc transporter 1/2/3